MENQLKLLRLTTKNTGKRSVFIPKLSSMIWAAAPVAAAKRQGIDASRRQSHRRE
jgi:hypothetical protein